MTGNLNLAIHRCLFKRNKICYTSVMEKLCNHCLVLKPLSDFYIKRTGRLGTTSLCKVCFKEKIKKPSKRKKVKNYKDYLREAGLLDYYKNITKYY